MAWNPVPPTSPPATAVRVSAAPRPIAAPLLVLAAVVALAVVAWVALGAWSRHASVVVPRDRAEALCLVLAEPPVFDPPMVVEPSSALTRDRFAPGTTAPMALRQTMRFDEEMVAEERSTRFGDYDVTTLWLTLPPGETARHWLLVTWFEGDDLAVCTFRFAGTDRELSPEARAWGDRLLERVLRPEHFRAGALPRVTLRGGRDGRPAAFGPD